MITYIWKGINASGYLVDADSILSNCILILYLSTRRLNTCLTAWGHPLTPMVKYSYLQLTDKQDSSILETFGKRLVHWKQQKRSWNLLRKYMQRSCITVLAPIAGSTACLSMGSATEQPVLEPLLPFLKSYFSLENIKEAR